MAKARWYERLSAGVLVLALGASACFGFITIHDLRNRAVARDLAVHGARASAHDAQFWFARTCRTCTDPDRVRAVVEFPDGPARVDLTAAWPWSDADYDYDVWIPADSAPYTGTFDVLYDPSDHQRVIAVEDVAVTEEDVRIDAALTGGALLMAGVGGLLVWAPWSHRVAGAHSSGHRRRH